MTNTPDHNRHSLNFQLDRWRHRLSRLRISLRQQARRVLEDKSLLTICDRQLKRTSEIAKSNLASQIRSKHVVTRTFEASRRDGTTPRKSVYIWETGSHFPALLTKLKQLQWDVRGIVRKAQCSGEIEGLPILSPATLLPTIDPDDVMIPGDPTPEDPQAFLRSLSEIRDHCGIPNRVVHPVALAEAHTYDRPRFLVAGLPGSGNMIVQSLLDKIVQHRKAPSPSSLDTAMVALASAYYWSLHNVIKSQFDRCGAAHWHVTPWETAYGAAVTGHSQDCSNWQIAGLPLRSHLWAVDLAYSHETPFSSAIDYYARNSFNLITLLRHPLDVIVSIAGKISRDSGLEDPGLLLSDSDWYRSMIDAVGRYFSTVAEHQHRLHIYRYEDLLSDPIGYMSSAQELFAVNLPQWRLEKLWAQFGLKPLATALGRHYWQPGVGKWQKYMNPTQAQIIKKSILPAVAEEFGYSLSEISGNFSPSHDWKTLPASTKRNLAYWDCFYSHLLPKERALDQSDLFVVYYDELGLASYGFDPEGMAFSRSSAELISSPEFADLIAAAYLGDLTIPPRRPIGILH